jgi:membrane protein YdbS with pleckstrin-like domain
MILFTIILLSYISIIGMTFLIIYFEATESYPESWYNIIIITSGIALIIFLIGYFLINYYYPTINYKVTDEEIFVNRGLITKSNKIVPYRTITNIDIKQGPFDRILGIGSIEIQTAGFSAGKTGPEERLDGIPTQLIKELRNLILNKVRKVKGSPGTSHDLDHPEEDVLTAILNEIIKLKSILLERTN